MRKKEDYSKNASRFRALIRRDYPPKNDTAYGADVRFADLSGDRNHGGYQVRAAYKIEKEKRARKGPG